MASLDDTLQARLAAIKDGVSKRERGEEVFAHIPTGLRTWDKNGGIFRGILTVIGAATGEGKSILKLQLARGAAEAGFNVLALDFEDPAERTADRVISGYTGIDNRLLGMYNLDSTATARIEAAVRQAGGWAKKVKHEPGLKTTAQTIDLISAFGEGRGGDRESKGDLVLVDYAQAFPESEDRNMERTIADVSWKASELAQKYNMGIVFFSQIIRDVEQRGYRIYERSKYKDPERVDVSGFCPGGLSDISWAKAMGERAKELGYIWREGRIARKLGANVKDNRLRLVWGKVNFGEERDMVFYFDGPTATIKDL